MMYKIKILIYSILCINGHLYCVLGEFHRLNGKKIKADNNLFTHKGHIANFDRYSRYQFEANHF